MQVEGRGVSVAYGSRVVFEDLDIVVPRGEIGVLVGPSGSGKSTLLAVLAGFQVPDAGEVLHRDAIGRAATPSPADVAWMPQGLGGLEARSAIDNVAIAALSRGRSTAEARELAEHCLALVDLRDHRHAPCRRLSGGERQRLALARALATERTILMVDEPTSNLDAGNTSLVAHALARLRGEVTVLVATHDPALMRISEHVISLRGSSGAS